MLTKMQQLALTMARDRFATNMRLALQHEHHPVLVEKFLTQATEQERRINLLTSKE